MTRFEPDPQAVTRTQETRTPESHTSGEGELSVQTIAQTYATTVADLWDAVTNPERLPRWFAPVEGDLKLGGRYQVEGNAGGTIETCEPPHEFRATWEFNEQVSWVAVTIRPDGDGARLELQHSAVVDPANQEQVTFWETYGPGAAGVGWDLAFLGLGQHLAGGAAMDPAQAEAWSTSEEGIAYITACSRAWGEAHVAAGASQEEADAAVAHTTAFYTGQPEPTPTAYLVVGLDGSERSHDALGFALEEARLRQATVRVLTTWDGGGESRAQSEQIQQEARTKVLGDHDGNPPVEFDLVEGRPEVVLVNESARAVMLVIGAHGVQSIRRAALGSISEYVARMATCPVVVIPARAWGDSRG